MAPLRPIETVFVEFLRNLSVTMGQREPVVLILRGSVLLRHWFGARARPAADIDLECFERIRGGRGDRFTSLVDHGRALCSFAAEDWQSREVAFLDLDNPDGGESLWAYGSPGERFIAGWVWSSRGESGHMQIDVAQSGSYDLKDIDIADVVLTALDGHTFRFPAYTPEMMLAAKLSWLMRSWVRKKIREGRPVWKGDPKDLFDLHLLLTKADLNAEAFRKSLLAVGTDDALTWNDLETLFDVRRGEMEDDDFANWPEFCARHPGLISCGPVEMLRSICDRMEPLLGDFYLRAEMPFILAINAGPADEFSHLAYADWLEERGAERAHFLRLFTKFHFRKEEMPSGEWLFLRSRLKTVLRRVSVPWLHLLFGTSARVREICQRIEG